MRFIVGSGLLLLVLGGTSSYLSAQCNTCPERRTISVTGTGKVTADADLAIVRVGYKLYGADAKIAYASATATSNAIMKALTDSGITKDAIESTSQALQHTNQYDIQQFPPSSDEWKSRQFTATQSWLIRVKPDDAASALNTAINAGANESGWIEWIVQSPSNLRAEASAKAVADARMLAEQIAQRSNVQLGHLVSAMENQWPWGNSGGGVISGLVGMGTGIVDKIQFGNEQLVINSRQVEFSVSVSAVFAIE